jgi:UDP-N-acetylglucosamine pyrophosphorylase
VSYNWKPPSVQLSDISKAPTASMSLDDASFLSRYSILYKLIQTCSDLFLVKSDLYSLSHGNLILNTQRFPLMAPLVKLGNHYKKVSDFQKRIPNIPKILELDHLTITGDVNLGKNVALRGTVIIVASNNDTIDIPPGSVLENVLLLQVTLMVGGCDWLLAYLGALKVVMWCAVWCTFIRH